MDGASVGVMLYVDSRVEARLLTAIVCQAPLEDCA
jgi:hypothetical protein